MVNTHYESLCGRFASLWSHLIDFPKALTITLNRGSVPGGLWPFGPLGLSAVDPFSNPSMTTWNMKHISFKHLSKWTQAGGRNPAVHWLSSFISNKVHYMCTWHVVWWCVRLYRTGVSIRAVNGLFCFMGRAPAASTNSIRTIKFLNVESPPSHSQENQFKRNCWQ